MAEKIVVTLDLTSPGVALAVSSGPRAIHAYSDAIAVTMREALKSALAGSVAGVMTLPSGYGHVRYRVEDR